MKGWLLIPLGAAAVVLVWLALNPERRGAVTAALGLTTPPAAAAKKKPICDYPVNPKVAAPVDCIPQHLANLPPDPGPEGKLTIDGIDADKNGMRDDVQRWIATEWGHSRIAVKALTLVAQGKLFEVHHGGELGREETRKLVRAAFETAPISRVRMSGRLAPSGYRAAPSTPSFPGDGLR